MIYHILILTPIWIRGQWLVHLQKNSGPEDILTDYEGVLDLGLFDESHVLPNNYEKKFKLNC